MIERIVEKHNSLARDHATLECTVKNLQADLTTIHAHYRAKLCGDCCHADVCGVSPSVKYGYECEDKAHPVGLAINIVDLSEPEPKKEEKQ
jgi:hypothetical protein